MNQKQVDQQFMLLAILEARKAQGQTGQNPIVGCVIVEQGELVAKSYHKQQGAPHAEVEALKALGRSPKPDAVMYVTLEPCSTQGKTGACTDVIIQAGISRVVFGTIDPNPDHRGKAVDILKAANIAVTTKILEKECSDLNPEFNQRMEQL